MEQQKKMIENEHLSSLEKLKEREEEIRQLHKVMIVASIISENTHFSLLLELSFGNLMINNFLRTNQDVLQLTLTFTRGINN